MKNRNKKRLLYAGVLMTILFLVGTVVITGDGENPDRIFDVNRDGIINFKDAGLCFVYIHDEVDNEYGNLLYDVNFDGVVSEDDCIEIWMHRD